MPVFASIKSGLFIFILLQLVALLDFLLLNVHSGTAQYLLYFVLYVKSAHIMTIVVTSIINCATPIARVDDLRL